MRKIYTSLVFLGIVMLLAACQNRLRPIENITVECDTVRWLPREDVVYYDVFLNDEVFRVMAPNARLENIPQGIYSLTIEYATANQRSARSRPFDVVSKPKLDAPQNVFVENGILTFDPVPNALGYVIHVGNERFETIEPRLDLRSIDRPDFYVIEVSALPSETCLHGSSVISDSQEDDAIFEFNYTIDVSRQRDFSFDLDEIDFIGANLIFGDLDKVTWRVEGQVLEFTFSPLIENQSQAVVLVETLQGTGILQFSFTTQEAPFLITPSTQTYQSPHPVVFEFNRLTEVRFELFGPELETQDFEVIGQEVRILPSYLERHRDTNGGLLILQYRLTRGQDIQIGFLFILFDE